MRPNVSPLADANAEPSGQITTPFLIYVGLTVIAAVIVTIASGPEHLSRTHHKLVEPSGALAHPRPEPRTPAVSSTSPAIPATAGTKAD